jgi:hypothetical protein
MRNARRLLIIGVLVLGAFAASTLTLAVSTCNAFRRPGPIAVLRALARSETDGVVLEASWYYIGVEPYPAERFHIVLLGSIDEWDLKAEESPSGCDFGCWSGSFDVYNALQGTARVLSVGEIAPNQPGTVKYRLQPRNGSPDVETLRVILVMTRMYPQDRGLGHLLNALLLPRVMSYTTSTSPRHATKLRPSPNG